MATSINFPTYGFINDTLALNEENWRKFFKPFVYDSVQSGLVTTAGIGMTVNISAGECRCGAVMGILDGAITLDVDNGDATYDRIDSVVIQYSYGNPSTLSVTVKKGTASASPVAPTLSKVYNTLWEMEIAQILVPSGATSSSSLTITDKRVIYESIEDAIDDIVISSSTEPTSPMNEIWFKDEPDEEYTVPTNAEFTELEQDVTDLKNSIFQLNKYDAISENFHGSYSYDTKTAFDYSYNNEHTGFNFSSTIKPYYTAGFYAYYAEINISIPNGTKDVWIGGSTESGFVGSCLTSKEGNNLRYVQNGSNTALTIGTVDKIVLATGKIYNLTVIIVGRHVTIWNDYTLIQDYYVDDYDLLGVGILNYGFPANCINSVKIRAGRNLVYHPYPPQNDRSLKKFYDNTIVNVQAQYFDDTPTGKSGVLQNYRFSENYIMQIYNEYGGSTHSVYYRIINKNGTIYIPWQLFDNETVHRNTSEINDATATSAGWSRFTDLPANIIYNINLPTLWQTLGFPTSSAGIFISIDSYGAQGTSVYNYRLFTYITNSPSEINRVYVCFGHGSSITPWTSIDTFNGPGNKNPLAEALFDSNSKIVFVGDSIVAGLGGTGYDVSASGGGDYIMYRGFDRYENVTGYCWVNEMISHISTVYGKTNCKNRGVGGITTKEINNNFDTIIDGATMIILSCGSNDYNNNANINTYLPQIIKKCVKNNIGVMVLTNISNNTSTPNPYNAVQGRIQQVCSAMGVKCYDMHAEFEMVRKLKNLSLGDVFDSDGIHPNDTGYGIMYDCALRLFGI